jgi:anti-anti-sigma factor
MMTDGPLVVEPTSLAGAPGLTLRGELDMSTLGQLEDRLQRAVLESAGAFVVDLSDLTFMDSSGVNALLRARSLLGREERALVVVCPPGNVRRVLELIGVMDVLGPFATRAEAERALVPAD